MGKFKRGTKYNPTKHTNLMETDVDFFYFL